MFNNAKNKVYKLTLFTPERNTLLTDQAVVFSGEPVYVITWKGRSFYKSKVCERPDALPLLIYIEVSTCELSSISLCLKA
jgi:hypothetical protein